MGRLDQKFVKKYFSKILKKIISRRDITFSEAKRCLIYLLDHKLGMANDVCFGAFFAALQTKKPTVDEVAGLIDVVMNYDRKSIEIKRNFKGPLCGIIGSGKDDLKTFNISSTASLVAAAAGVKVLKNGSRAESSIAGTTDVFEELGANVLLKSRKKLGKSINEINFGFCDAEPYFPKMVKEYLGKFYFIHPLSFILPIASGLKFDRVVFGLGNDNIEFTTKLLIRLGYDNSLVVVGYDREGRTMDEISNIGKTKISEIKNKRAKIYLINPEDLGFKISNYKFIKEGRSPKANAIILKNIVNNKDRGPRRDVVLMNAGAVIYVAGVASSIKEGTQMAAEAIDSGRASNLLNNFIQIFN